MENGTKFMGLTFEDLVDECPADFGTVTMDDIKDNASFDLQCPLGKLIHLLTFLRDSPSACMQSKTAF